MDYTPSLKLPLADRIYRALTDFLNPQGGIPEEPEPQPESKYDQGMFSYLITTLKDNIEKNPCSGFGLAVVRYMDNMYVVVVNPDGSSEVGMIEDNHQYSAWVIPVVCPETVSSGETL